MHPSHFRIPCSAVVTHAGDPCVKFDFFPQGSSLAGPAPSNCTSQDTPGGCNWPGAWQKESQDSTDPDRPDDQMYKVALAEDNGLILPRFLWTLSTPLSGGGVTECVNAMVSPASQQHLRKLLASTEWTASDALTSPQVSIKLENANTGAAYAGFSQQTLTTSTSVLGKTHQVTLPGNMAEVRGFKRGTCLVA